MFLVIPAIILSTLLHSIVEVSCTKMDVGVKCLPWEKPEQNGTYCVCRNDLPLGMHCEYGELYVDANKCLTYTNGTLYEISCPYHKYKHISTAMLKVPRNISEVNYFFCGTLGRTGLLCGQCKQHTGISVLTGSYRCSECNEVWRNWLAYASLSFLPITAFFVVIFVLQLPITSPSLKLYIFYSQGITIIFNYDVSVWNQVQMHCTAPMQTILDILLTFYEPWNLDFFKHVIKDRCLSEHLKGIHVNALSYVQPLYILTLIFLMHFCYKLNNYTIKHSVLKKLVQPFTHCASTFKLTRNPKSSLIDAITGFYFLCSIKLILCSLLIFRNTHVRNISKSPPERVTEVVYIEPSLPYAGRQHFPHIVLATAVLGLLLVILLFSTCYTLPFFRRALNWFGSYTFMQYIHVLADKVQGHYKDGTNNKYDLRIFFVLPFVVQVTMLITPVFHTPHNITYITRGLILISSGKLMLIARPYKQDWYNIIDAVWFSYMGLQCILIHILLHSRNINIMAIISILLVSMALPKVAVLSYAVFRVTVLSKNRLQQWQEHRRQENGVNINNDSRDNQGNHEIEYERKPLLPQI